MKYVRWNMSDEICQASTSTYPENLGSGGQLPAELRGRVCLFCLFFCMFVCPSHYDARHRKPRWCVFALNLGGTGISPPDSFSFRSSFRFRSRSRSPDKKPPGPRHPTSGDIFYCSGSRQVNHSSLFLNLLSNAYKLFSDCFLFIEHTHADDNNELL